MNQKTFVEHEDQFIVSYELLYMLQWIMTYEQQALIEIIHKAFVQGSQVTHNASISDQFEQGEYVQNSVVDFFSFLEMHVQNIAEQESMKHIMQNSLLKTLDHIDPHNFDPALVRASMMATAEKVTPQQNHQAKAFFLKQLLKKWNPHDKNKKHNRH
jgi:hypothetical protein